MTAGLFTPLRSVPGDSIEHALTTTPPLTHERDLPTASEETLLALAHHLERIRAERLPNDLPSSLEMLIRALRQRDPDADQHHLLVWRDGAVIAHAVLTFPLVQNTTQAAVTLTVLPAERRQGLARRLLDEIAQLAAHHGRPTLLTTASDRVPAGEAALRHLDAQCVMRQQFMELDLQRLDQNQLAVWATGRSSDPYTIWWQVGPYPEGRLAEIGRLRTVMHSAPQGARQREEHPVTPAELRAEEALLQGRGRRRLTTFAESRASGELVAFTELVWDEEQPAVMIQHGTAVRPDHRRQALGWRIKVVNLLVAAEVNPLVRWVRAGNTDDNVGMLRINRRLGFRPYLIHTDWQIELETVQRYLAACERE